jgi:hypothetical protein
VSTKNEEVNNEKWKYIFHLANTFGMNEYDFRKIFANQYVMSLLGFLFPASRRR